MSIDLQAIRSDHETAFLEAVDRSQQLHHPWVTPPATSEAFHAFVSSADGGRKVCYLAVNETHELVGCINLNEIVRGAFQSAYLGYYAFAPFAGTGLMKQAMVLVIEKAFKNHKLHRLEANIQPGNSASLALVQALGFRHEGFSARYLRIDGQWRDHERYAITAEDWQASQTIV